MKIQVLATDFAKGFERGEDVLLDRGYTQVGTGVISTNDGHEVKAIFEKEGNKIYILNVAYSNVTVTSVTVCAIEEKEYMLV